MDLGNFAICSEYGMVKEEGIRVKLLKIIAFVNFYIPITEFYELLIFLKSQLITFVMSPT